MAKHFDVVVVGSGPGGYVAAIRAAQLGKKTAIVERENLGGICLNWGCIPTKALLKTSELYRAMTGEAEHFGLKAEKVSFDAKAVIKRSRDVAARLSKGVAFLMKKNKVEVIEGFGRFTAPGQLTVEKDGKQVEAITADNFIIATGARARTIPGVLEADEKNIWTYRTAMVPEKMPKSLLVIGAGAIGIEFASFYAAFGVKVTVVEALNTILPVEDAEVAAIAQKSMAKRGIEFMCGAKVKSLKSAKDGVSASIEDSKGKTADHSFDKALLAIGVAGNVESLGFETVGVRTEKGHIVVDRLYRTGAPGIWAIGDVIGAPWLAHVASHEGIICAEAIAGKNPHPMDYGNIPGCTYCTPQVASVGLTEAKAKEAGREVKVGRFNYQANGKAIAIGEDEGLVKTVFDAKTGELLGAHIVGAEATEMVSTFVLGRTLEVTEEDFTRTCLPHPTLSEMMGESVLDSLGRVVNA